VRQKLAQREREREREKGFVLQLVVKRFVDFFGLGFQE
jgi:hypothetical protein